METSNTLLFTIMLCLLFSCSQPTEEKAFEIFNKGVSFSIDAGKLQAEGKDEESKKMHLLAIEKFKQTLKLDKSHKEAASSIGFSFYEIKDYDEAIKWFKTATKVQTNFAVNHQFLGLSLINKGKVEEGEKSINRAFELDDSEAMKSNTVENLVYIGNLAYSYGEAYEQEGNKEQGNAYRKFGVRVLKSAYNYSGNDKKIGKMLEGYRDKVDDEI